jgi:hypothetical protein
MALFRTVVKSVVLVAFLAVVAGCSQTNDSSDGPDTGVNTSSALASWKSGACPADGSAWGGFSVGLDVPTGSPAPSGAPVALLPATVTVDRIMLCEFSGAGDRLSGSALVTAPGTIARLVHDLNSVTAAQAATCVGKERIMILVGHGNEVAGLDGSLGSCPYLGGPTQLVYYGRTQLLRDVDAALSTAR